MESYFQHSAEHHLLLEHFADEFSPIFTHMEASCQDKLLEYAPILFEKWCHAALVADTLLTPANLFRWDKTEAFRQEALAYSMELPQRDKNGNPVFSYRVLRYSLSAHPLLEDLKTLVDFCRPARPTDAAGMLSKEDQADLLALLSRKDTFYPEYLMLLARESGLIQDMPSIYSRQVQPGDLSLLSAPLPQALRTLTKAAFRLTVRRMTNAMELEVGLLKEDFFRPYLADHCEIDRIFIDFYRLLDIEVEEIWQKNPEELDEYDQGIVSSFLFTGMMLDKWFLTPFSAYFCFIEPIYYTPYRFLQVLNNLTAMLLMKHHTDAEVYSPCSYYSLNALGKALFAKEPLSEDRQALEGGYTLPKLLEMLEGELQLTTFRRMLLQSRKEEIFVLHIALEQRQELWKTIESTGSMRLNEFCEDICAAFDIPCGQDYQLALYPPNGLPIYYAPAVSKRAINRIDGMIFEDLSLQVGDSMRLQPFSAKGKTLRLTLTEKKQADPFVIYPRIKAQSHAMTAEEQAEEYDRI